MQGKNVFPRSFSLHFLLQVTDGLRHKKEIPCEVDTVLVVSKKAEV